MDDGDGIVSQLGSLGILGSDPFPELVVNRRFQRLEGEEVGDSGEGSDHRRIRDIPSKRFPGDAAGIQGGECRLQGEVLDGGIVPVGRVHYQRSLGSESRRYVHVVGQLRVQNDDAIRVFDHGPRYLVLSAHHGVGGYRGAPSLNAEQPERSGEKRIVILKSGRRDEIGREDDPLAAPPVEANFRTHRIVRFSPR